MTMRTLCLKKEMDFEICADRVGNFDGVNSDRVGNYDGVNSDRVGNYDRVADDFVCVNTFQPCSMAYINNYFCKQGIGWTPFARIVFSIQNLNCLRTELCIQKCEELDFMTALVEEYDRFIEVPAIAFSTDLCLLRQFNQVFIYKQRQLQRTDEREQFLYDKYVNNPSLALSIFPYPQSNGLHSRNTRGFNADELAIRKNDVQHETNHALDNPQNRFLNDYRCKMFSI